MINHSIVEFGIDGNIDGIQDGNIKYILKLEVFNCYVMVVSFGRRVWEDRLPVCVLYEGVSVCCPIQSCHRFYCHSSATI